MCRESVTIRSTGVVRCSTELTSLDPAALMQTVEPSASAEILTHDDGWLWRTENLKRLAALPELPATKGSLPCEGRQDPYIDRYIAHKWANGRLECMDLLLILTRSCVNHSIIAYQACRRYGVSPGPEGLSDPTVVSPFELYQLSVRVQQSCSWL